MAVYFAALKEKAMWEYPVDAIEAVCLRAGYKGYSRITYPSARTDITRNSLVKMFRHVSKEPDDFLVMLDYDMQHPVDIVEKLVAHNRPVVGALYMRRGAPYDPMVFFRDKYGNMTQPRTWEPRLYKCSCVATGAMAIKCSVFDRLDAAGFNWPYFRYTYPPGNVHPSEDLYFGEICERAKIETYCDMSIEIPHITVGLVTREAWQNWLADHPNGGGDINMTEKPVELERLE